MTPSTQLKQELEQLGFDSEVLEQIRADELLSNGEVKREMEPDLLKQLNFILNESDEPIEGV